MLDESAGGALHKMKRVEGGMAKESTKPDYPHSVHRQVCLHETDAFGHANNVTYFKYLEVARFEFMKEAGLFDPNDILSCNYILAHAECDYRRISRYNDVMVIYSRVAVIGKGSFTLDHLLVNERTGATAATGKVVMVSYDHGEARTRPISDAERRLLDAYRGNVREGADAPGL